MEQRKKPNLKLIDKITMLCIYMQTNRKATDIEKTTVKTILASPALESSLSKISSLGFLDENGLTPQGIRFCAIMSSMYTDFEKIAKSTNIGSSMAMISAGIKNISTKVEKGKIVMYEGKSLHQLISELNIITNNLLENAVKSNESDLVKEGDLIKLMDILNGDD